MLKKNTNRTSIDRLEGRKPIALTSNDLRRTMGALVSSVTSGASTANCDDWCDCD